MELRKYEKNTPQFFLYKEMHENQTLEYVLSKKKQYKSFTNKLNVKTALSMLDDFIDPSDPDLDVPNSIHAFQTAERIRKKDPQNKQLQLIGLIHDLGKILFSFNEPNWSVVGDTFVVGCEYPKSIVYYDTLKNNPDFNKYDKLGIYKENCGIENLHLSYGHDEYLYQVLLFNKNHKLSKKYLNIIRFHSFYPWHTEGEYKHFMNVNDKNILNDILNFNQYDLYSKEDDTNIPETTKQYYFNLIDEFFDGDIYF